MADQSEATSEGRRIYLGNLDYSVQPEEIEECLRNEGYEFERIHASIDPVSGRNPGYVFADLVRPEDAQRAIEGLVVELKGRRMKVGPCEPKKNRNNGFQRSQPESLMQRWGNWDNKGDRVQNNGEEQGYRHFERQQFSTEVMKTRLHISGLNKMDNQEQHNEEMLEILDGLNPVAIGKRITPSDRQEPKTDREFEQRLKHYCFVDFADEDSAAAALDVLKGKKSKEGHPLFVNYARPPREQKNISRAREGYQGSPQRSFNQSPRQGQDQEQRDPREQREQRERRYQEVRSMGSWR